MATSVLRCATAISIIIPLLSVLLLVLAEDEETCSNLISQCNKDFTTKCLHQKYVIKNCCNLKMFSSPTGLYKIMTEKFKAADVWCDMDIAGGGWIVIQRNKKNGAHNFNRHFKHYESGFGNLTTEFWYGLKLMSCLTQVGQWEMRIDILDNNKKKNYLHYNTFKVGTAELGYPLTIEGYTKRGIDPFSGLSGRKFSAPDRDNDQVSTSHCAAMHQAGWWYYTTCDVLNFNRQPPVLHPNTVLLSEMKIRPKDCISL